MVGCLFCLLFFLMYPTYQFFRGKLFPVIQSFVTIFAYNFSLMYPDILISSFFGVLFPVIQLFCDLFFLFFTLANVPRNLHFFIHIGAFRSFTKTLCCILLFYFANSVPQNFLFLLFWGTSPQQIQFSG